MLILQYDDLKKDPLDFIKKIFRFIEVDDTFVPSVLNKPILVGKYSEPLRLINVIGRKIEPISPKSQKMIEFGVRRLRKKFVKQRHPKMDKKTREGLKKVFRDENIKLGRLLNRDLGSWL